MGVTILTTVLLMYAVATFTLSCQCFLSSSTILTSMMIPIFTLMDLTHLNSASLILQVLDKHLAVDTTPTDTLITLTLNLNSAVMNTFCTTQWNHAAMVL